MTDRWDRVKRIVADALEMDAAVRPAFLADACGTDDDLRAEVVSLLAADDPAGRFLEPDRHPDRIGSYRIVREIGRGGMGTVYEGARADAQFEQRVAIKVVKRGMDTDAVLRRFVAERQVLARLQHPSIARLFDGGMTADGRPYFVMEYLDAKPITTYCDERSLGSNARVDLFASVCDAVEYAHSHLVLHRDLKPANIIVDASGTPKLLDFGIAKLLDETDPSGTVTEVGHRAMTPKYASPEQRRGDPLTTASDVYALGLLLRELVPDAGRRGDLDRIVRKALEEDVRRRYQRAGELAEDLRRYRASRPVTARPSGFGYRASKYAARHWRALSVAAASLAVVVVAVGNALIEGRRADRHFREVRQLANSFLFEFHDAIAKLPGATPARELVLKRAVEYLDKLSGEAANDVDLKRELAESYERVGEAQGLYYDANLGKNGEAARNLEKSIALYRDVVRARPSDVGALGEMLNAMVNLGSALNGLDPPRRGAMFDEVIARVRSNPSGSDPRLQMMLANALTGRAEDLIRAKNPAASLEARNEAVAIHTKLAALRPPHPGSERLLSIGLKRRASLYLSNRDLARALADLDAARAIDQRHIDADATDAVAKIDLALGESYRAAVLQRTGDFAGALDAIERALTIRRAMLQADPQNARLRTLVQEDEGKLPAFVDALRKSGAPEALIQRAQALASPSVLSP
ncbi:MAG TPA: serine/threonine-protein kinase [Vicinamibacterales bacterium]|nr:serine/threonine-protein kinase [Vicinamibacterales bacterium]